MSNDEIFIDFHGIILVIGYYTCHLQGVILVIIILVVLRVLQSSYQPSHFKRLLR